MQHSDNDMDELFRKAAENYPLKTDAGNWDNIIPFVSNAQIGLEKHGQKKWIGGPFFIVSAILTLLFIGVFFEHLSHKQYKKSGPPVIEHRPSAVGIATGKPGDNNSTRKTTAAAVPHTLNKTQIAKLTAYKNYDNICRVAYKSSKMLKDDKTQDIGEKRLVGYTGDDVKAVQEFASFSISPTNNVFTEKLISHFSLPVVAQTISIKNRNRIFYLGLEAGLQLNQVKGQGFNKAGFSAGFMAGLQLNKKLSVETGIAWSKKYFYTDGKYFDMNKAGSGMPANMTVLSLNSCSNIFEIPVSIKYNIIRNNSSDWSITAGISSYIVTKETNDYLAVINGQQKNVQGQYTRSKNYFSAVAQLGIGYQYKLRKQTTLRIEPYIQIPIKGIGIGSVQVMTAGLHLGVIKYTNR